MEIPKSKYNGAYVVLGYPTLEKSLEVIREIIDKGFNFIELGLPFSDPLADGLIIKEAMKKTLNQEFKYKESLDYILNSVRDFPFYIMTYSNILYNWGLDKFSMMYQGKIKGVIVPDLPTAMIPFFRKRGFTLPIVPFITLESREEDFKALEDSYSDFIYLISTRGITGSSVDFRNDELISLIEQVRKFSNPTQKIVIGFGIKEKNDIEAVLTIADGAIIGSQIVQKQDNFIELSSYLSRLL